MGRMAEVWQESQGDTDIEECELWMYMQLMICDTLCDLDSSQTKGGGDNERNCER